MPEAWSFKDMKLFLEIYDNEKDLYNQIFSKEDQLETKNKMLTFLKQFALTCDG